MSNEGVGVVPEWTVGDRMIKARTVADLSQEQMGEYLGLSRVTLSRYETGHNRVPLTVLRLWAMRCGVPLDWLRYGDAPPLPEVTAGPKPRPKGPKRPNRRTSTGWLIVPHRLAAAA
jgi:transcriptional regulator with XRE-family HTH domain